MSDKEPDIKIFVSHRIDQDSRVIKNNIFYPVRCGAVYDNREAVNIPGDDTGENISTHRETLNELTVMYWAWKNVKADFYGLCHYRRYMNFSDEVFPEDNFGNVILETLDDQSIENLHLDDVDQIQRSMKGIDYAYTDFDVKKVGYKNVREQYCKALESLHEKDLDIAMTVLEEKSPEMIPYAQEYFSGRHFYPCLNFIMKHDIFARFCEWLFPIALEIEKRLECPQNNINERRNPAHIAERLLGVYILYLREKHPEYHGMVFQRVLFLDTSPDLDLRPASKENNIPICFTSSEYFIPYLSVAVRSMLKNSSSAYHYDIVILNTGIHQNVKKILREDLREFHNCTLRFFNVKGLAKELEFQKETLHFTVDSFYRLFIPQVFKHYKKVLFCDCDILVLDDVSELFHTDLEGKMIAATHDADFVGEYCGGVPSMKKYVDDELQLKNPMEYFQAGVLIFDIEGINQRKMSLVDTLGEKVYHYADQDVLNDKFQGEVHFLDMRWNVLADCYSIRVDKLIKRAPYALYKDYMNARKNPGILHYAGGEKPFYAPMMDFSTIYWHYARESIFYEEIVARLGRAYAGGILYRPSFVHRMADRCFPKDSGRREVLKRIIPRGSVQWNISKRLYHIISPEFW